MAGFREFVTGEVLTAANVNDYLGKQAVMKFADASARDTALGTAVGGSNALREGMVAYLDDTDEVLAYDGTAWSSLGLPLGTATPTDGQILAFGTATSTWNPTDGGGLVQYVSDYGTTTSTISGAETWTDIPESEVTITPTNASNLLVVLFTGVGLSQNASGSAEEHRTFQFRMLKDGVLIPTSFVQVGRDLVANSNASAGSRDFLVMRYEQTAGGTSPIVFKAQHRDGEYLSSSVFGPRSMSVMEIRASAL